MSDHPPIPPESKYFEKEDNVWFFVIRFLGVPTKDTVLRLQDKWFHERWRPVIAAVAIEGWEEWYYRTYRDKEHLPGAHLVLESQKAWRKWSKDNGKAGTTKDPSKDSEVQGIKES